MATTLLLDQTTHDLCLDASGNIALASEPYSQAQDAGCYIRTFLGDCWYDQSLGIPYLQSILGQPPDPVFTQAQVEFAALAVPGVTSAVVTLASPINRNLTGTVQTTSDLGVGVVPV